MFGMILWAADAGRKVYAQEEICAGLPVLCVRLSPNAWGRTRRLKKAARFLSFYGIRRILVPEGFDDWSAMERFGLKPVDPLPFLRLCAGPLLVAAIKKQGYDPGRSSVALRGARTDRDMTKAAEYLASRVRDVVISADTGGENLRRYLQREWGIAPRPDTRGMEGVICFDGTARRDGAVVLCLYEEEMELLGVTIRQKDKELPPDSQKLPFLTALWETGRLQLEESLEFT